MWLIIRALTSVTTPARKSDTIDEPLTRLFPVLSVTHRGQPDLEGPSFVLSVEGDLGDLRVHMVPWVLWVLCHVPCALCPVSFQMPKIRACSC